MNIKNFLPVVLILLLLISCGTNNKLARIQYGTRELSSTQQELLDSILSRGLDYEALYTMIGKIKPMSSVASFTFPIANTDSLKKTKGEVLDLPRNQAYLAKIEQIQEVINTLNYPDLKFVFIPYNHAYSEKRILQLSVVRESLMNRVLHDKASFFGQFGLVPGADPAVVVSTIESSDRYERLRAYGYLFGYPEYAVDFFVDASVVNDQNGEFVERNFFQIPSFARDNGTFVYAYPQDHTPGKTDSTLFWGAQSVLAKYKEIRMHYLNQDSTLQSENLLNDFFYQEKGIK